MDADRNDSTPSYGETLLDVLSDAAAQGYDVQQIARSNERIECTHCDAQTSPEDIDADRVNRLEGASDTADLLLVVWTTCPSCGRGGVLTLGYGPNASETDSNVLSRLDLSTAEP